MFKAFKKKQNRVLALVHSDGNIEIIDHNNIKGHPVMDFVNSDLSIINSTGDVQSTKINIYEDVANSPEQILYSVPYEYDKKPYMDKSISKALYNVIWNYLEGDVSKKKIKLELGV